MPSTISRNHIQKLFLSYHIQGLLPDFIPRRNRSNHATDPVGNAIRHDPARQELSVAVLSGLIANAAVAGTRGIPDEVR